MQEHQRVVEPPRRLHHPHARPPVLIPHPHACRGGVPHAAPPRPASRERPQLPVRVLPEHHELPCHGDGQRVVPPSRHGRHPVLWPQHTRVQGLHLPWLGQRNRAGDREGRVPQLAATAVTPVSAGGRGTVTRPQCRGSLGAARTASHGGSPGVERPVRGQRDRVGGPRGHGHDADVAQGLDAREDALVVEVAMPQLAVAPLAARPHRPVLTDGHGVARAGTAGRGRARAMDVRAARPRARTLGLKPKPGLT